MQELIELIHEVRANKGQEAARVLFADGYGGVRLREDLGFDSMDLAELTVRIEERFGVDVFAEGVVRTVGEVEGRIRAAQDAPK
ncbi:phosphopantetheine-binding protein [Opitutales bacterium ASA1]|uniref:acyl carrier protein n=1 Tax=Congregicoccus parvus TaxID=3081749 RepID=UPI002B2D7705|nr:phosphopantetheine-binding protein [Opitutales bacterium ASA1]